MEMVGIHDAKAHLSGLIKRVCQGEEIIVTRSGDPVAKLVPYTDDGRIDLAETLGEIDTLRRLLGDSGGVLEPGETLKGIGREGLKW